MWGLLVLFSFFGLILMLIEADYYNFYFWLTCVRGLNDESLDFLKDPRSELHSVCCAWTFSLIVKGWPFFCIYVYTLNLEIGKLVKFEKERVTYCVLCINLFLYTWDALRVSVIEVTWASSWLWPLHGKTLLEQLKHFADLDNNRDLKVYQKSQMMALYVPTFSSCLLPRSRRLNVHGGNSEQRGRAQSVLQAGRGNCSLSL